MGNTHSYLKMNYLHQGDNLTILRNMPDASVDLICTDPPFNTGKDWGAFNDKWEGGLKGYLKFMEARAVEMQRVLKSTGSLYLHCDPTASHYLKVMLDSVFGIDNFRNEIVWHYKIPNVSKWNFPRNHDTIFRYSKTDIVIFNRDDVRIPYAPHSALKKGVKPTGFLKKGFKLSSKGKVVDTVWDITIAGKISTERLGYPTQKPVALYERMIKASS